MIDGDTAYDSIAPIACTCGARPDLPEVRLRALAEGLVWMAEPGAVLPPDHAYRWVRLRDYLGAGDVGPARARAIAAVIAAARLLRAAIAAADPLGVTLAHGRLTDALAALDGLEE